MAKPPPLKIAIEDVLILTLFAQRSPNAEFREQAFALALAALPNGATDMARIRPFCEFAARTKAKNPSAERAREVGARLLRESGHADLWTQLSGSMESGQQSTRARPRPKR
jgi:hypothetical protein